MRSLSLLLLAGAAGASAFALLRHSPLRPAAAVLTKPQDATARAVHMPNHAQRRAAALVLPSSSAAALEAPTRTPNQKGFLARLLKRRGGEAGKADMKGPLAEAIGTGILTLAAGMMSAGGMSGPSKALGVAATLYALLLGGAKHSGAHYNPIVTFGNVLLGKQSFGNGLAYVIAQTVGGLGGGFLAKALLAPIALGDPSFTLNGGNLLTEMFFSFSLVLTVLQTTVSKVQSRRGVAAPAIAAIVGLGAALGASMNPAVSWGLCSASGIDKGSLALWLFPALATIPAALAFRFSDADESEGASPHVSFLPKLASARNVRSIGPYVAEYTNTFMLTAAVSIALASGKLAGPVAAGLMFAVLNLAGSYVSGNHLNPAVTLGMFFRKGGDRSKAIGYVVAQLLGAFAAASSAHAAFGADAVVGKVLPAVAASATEGQAFGAEMLFTGLFLQSIFAFSGSSFGATTANLGVTAALTAGLAATGAISGGGLNPAVATALYLKNAAKDQARLLWLYWVAPCLGAVLTAVVNKGAAEGKAIGAN